jgi:hypothetical protein
VFWSAIDCRPNTVKEQFDVLAVCTGPRPDLGLVAQIMFGSGPGSNKSNQTNISDFLESFFFRTEKVIRSCVHLTLMTQ